MLLKKENPLSKMRTDLLRMTSEKDLSLNTRMAISKQMIGLTDEQKEIRASQMITIVNTSKTESEILLTMQELKVTFAQEKYIPKATN